MKLSLSVCAVLLVGVASRPDACCGVAPGGERVFLGVQQNLIVWEPETHTEHFVRRATFESGASSLGFIAPTPTAPELVEVSAKAFSTVRDAIRRFSAAQSKQSRFLPIVYAKSGAASGVAIIKFTNVAGYTATTLKATDSAALSMYLREQNYATDPDIEEWLRFYVKKGWYLTTFKVNVVDGNGTTGLVRMTFKTEHPFNPYYVPKSNISESSKRQGLQISLIAPAVYKPIGKFPLLREGSAARMQRDHILALRGQLQLGPLPADLAVTTFVDMSFPYAADEDIFFERSGDVPDWPRDPDWWLPWVFGAGLGIFLLRRHRRLQS